MRPKDDCRTFEEWSIDWLQRDLSRADELLKAFLEAYVEDNNISKLLYALQCITMANGEAFEFDSSEANKEGLDKLLNENPNPGWRQVLDALGYGSLEAVGDPVHSY